MNGLKIPLSTYRLQFNKNFTIKDAISLIDYFSDLGISTLYASPIFQSTPGSIHGYDIINFEKINPEIGTEKDFKALSQGLKKKGISLLVDFVPNHMCVLQGNKWWEDVLMKGRESPYACFFDVQWTPPTASLKDKILLPILENEYGKELENKTLKVVCENGCFLLDCKGRKLPLCLSSWSLLLTPLIEKIASPELKRQLTAQMSEDETTDLLNRSEMAKPLSDLLLEFNEDNESLDALLNEQHYRLSHWRIASEEINYRRFFDINELAGLRVEKKEVFDAVHAYLFKLIKQGLIEGLRIDHVDGMYHPKEYFFRLQEECRKAKRRNALFYVIVEKILVGPEQLSSTWPVFGTTGYDFLNLLNQVFVDATSKEALHTIYCRFTGETGSWEKTIYDSKKFILTLSMASELRALARLLEKLAEQSRWTRDFTYHALHSALIEIITCFPVYRTYLAPGSEEADQTDQAVIRAAVHAAKGPGLAENVFDFIENLLITNDRAHLSEEQKEGRGPFVMRFQQLTGPVTAKGVEDTAFYRYYPLASLNEVGMDAKLFGLSIQEFHQQNSQRSNNWPHTMLATFTHDTKRSEEVRARLNVLSEMPHEWGEAVVRWHALTAPYRKELKDGEAPGKKEELLLYQTLFGSWPFGPAIEMNDYSKRIQAYMVKALREAKERTSWHNPNAEYEKQIKNFVHCLLEKPNSFLDDFIIFTKPCLLPGFWNSLNQLILKMTCPGIPDFYQGSELWQFTLVDPDNRHPVDYGKRIAALSHLKKNPSIDQLVSSIEDGALKMLTMQQLLKKRNEHPQLFTKGSYAPLDCQGEKANHLIAFTRNFENQAFIIVVSRFLKEFEKPVGSIWSGTHLVTKDWQGSYINVVTEEEIRIGEDGIACDKILSHLPFAVLQRK
ncbi:MAG: malto-oligosyltrehalose synthase [Parachlamydia sp.]|jgi:(1->4)-alpha-D-glucan 1-alpha-D-glucosylmutase|nr:malto-oligosyltrehalose synthase [Parachlamydia sp.]